MKILITGANGVVGTKLYHTLKIRGHNVYGCDLFHSEKPISRVDISNYREIEHEIQVVNPDMVYNCAAEFGRWNGECHYEKVWGTNVIGLKHILKLRDIHKFNLVHFSSSEVYGDYDKIMTEEVMDNVPIVQMNDYAMSKWVNEMQIMNHIKSQPDRNGNVVRVRLFNTYGPGETYHPFRSVNCVFTYKLLKNQPIKVFTGHHRSSTYIDDCIDALCNIATNFIPGRVYNIGASTLHSIEELAELNLKHTGASRSLVTYMESEPMTTKTKIVDNSLCVKELNFKETVTLDEGVKRTAEWMREHYKL